MLRAIQVRQHVNFMSRRGFAVDDVLAGTGIEVERLSDSSYLVDIREANVVVSNIIRLTGNPAIGLKIGAATDLTDLGIVGYAMASSSTLGQAIALWLQYANSPVGFPFLLKLFTNASDGSWGLTAVPNGVSGSIYRFHVEEILAMGVSFGSLLTGTVFEMVEIAFSYPAPRHVAQYERRFRCPLVFDAPVTKAVVHAPPLETPLKSNDSELRELCIRHCSRLVRQVSRHGPLGTRLRDLLTTMGTVPSLDEAAEVMNMSPRNLRHRLTLEHTSFQKVLDEFRSDLAQEYLGPGMMAVKEVAYLLGYSQVEAFRRAFKSWTGQTIGQFQSTGNTAVRALSRESGHRQGSSTQ